MEHWSENLLNLICIFFFTLFKHILVPTVIWVNWIASFRVLANLKKRFLSQYYKREKRHIDESNLIEILLLVAILKLFSNIILDEWCMEYGIAIRKMSRLLYFWLKIFTWLFLCICKVIFSLNVAHLTTKKGRKYFRIILRQQTQVCCMRFSFVVMYILLQNLCIKDSKLMILYPQALYKRKKCGHTMKIEEYLLRMNNEPHVMLHYMILSFSTNPFSIKIIYYQFPHLEAIMTIKGISTYNQKWKLKNIYCALYFVLMDYVMS